MKRSKVSPKAAADQSEDDGVYLALFKGGDSLAVVDFTPAEFAAIESKTKNAGISFGDFLLKTAEAMAAKDADTRKIPRGYVMINLSESEKKEIRQLAQTSGLDLRGVLRNALIKMKYELKELAKVKLITGLPFHEQWRLFGHRSELN